MADASGDWVIEHVTEQTYDVINSLDYDATEVQFDGPNVAISRIDFGLNSPWRKNHEVIEAGAYVQESLTPKLTGQPSTFRLEISWTDPKGERHSGSYTIPQPGRSRPDLRSPVPPGFGAVASELAATRASKPANGVAAREYAETVPDVDPRDVFVVVGRNNEANTAMFTFLRAINLKPMEWSVAIAATGSGSPYIGDALEAAFARAKAVVVLMTPDDIAQLREEYASGPADPELQPTPQARPNVLFEAGMALGLHPDRTILVELGSLRSFSDVAGRHAVRIDNTPAKRNDLATRLRNAGCAVDTSGSDWYGAGDFTAPKAHSGPKPTGRRVSSASPAKPKSRLDARYLHRSSGSDRITVQNVGSEEVFDLTSPNARDFHGRIDGFPVRRLPVGKSATLIAIAAAGVPDTWDLIVTGRTESGEEFNESLFLDLNG
jgi:predicted nucleotide-binding protein